MKNYCRIIAGLWLGALLAVWAVPAWAQDEAPDEAAQDQAPKAKKDKKPKPKAEKGKAAEEPVVEITDPAVKALLATDPSAPAECLRAANILAGLDQPELCRKMLKRVLDAKPDEATLADLGETFGASVLLSLSGRKEMQPEATQVYNAVAAALQARMSDPQRLTALIQQLRDPGKSGQAAAEIRKIRSAAVGPLVDALKASASAADQQTIRAMLIAMGPDAAEPLIWLLDTAEPVVAAQAISVLGTMGYKPAKAFLLKYCLNSGGDAGLRNTAVGAMQRIAGRVPEKDEAIRILTAQVREYFEGRAAVAHEIEGTVELWTWDSAKKFAMRKLPSDDVRRIMAARLARDAFAIAPADDEVRTLYLVAMLEEAAYLQGLDTLASEKTVTAKAAAFGPKAVEDALRFAMKTQHPSAAVLAVQVLGEIGSAADLLYQRAMPAPLAVALQSPDRRLRLAAAEAIIRLQPVQPFAGSSYLVPALAFLAGSDGHPKAILAGPKSEDLRKFAGVLAAEHLLADTALTGRDVLRMTAASPDYELAVIDVQIDQPGADMLIQELRREPRSADLRVAVVAGAGWIELADKVARRDGHALSFSRALTDKDFQWQVNQLKAGKPREFVSRKERHDQAGRALDLLAEAAKSPSKLYEVRRCQDAVITALYTSDIGVKATAVLAQIGTPECQRALIEVANRFTQPIDLRKAAAKAFATNVKKSGILLTTEEIRRQYDRYNQGASLDGESLMVLASLLDTIEGPTQPLKQPSKPKPGATEPVKTDDAPVKETKPVDNAAVEGTRN